ncbi:Zn(2)-C6 fungal-type domain-containing protein [Trichoderma simmonsii]|uniref:Zn(2)-C6 fungal-type domain-containing protein n=1 Tax=Trichoderma simmonsii TaxID=1491479 RepID=A0A8G0LVE4_9HYPO|nr:Zn(2)-C6 fungal-type domain-containing protein [Trichoderma simmonsii]
MGTRVSKACQRCQRRKLKCDGSDGCLACKAAGQRCLYASVNRKRGLVEGYVKGLERLLGFAIQRDASLTTDIQRFFNRFPGQDSQTVVPESQTMLDSWKQSVLAKDVERLLPALEQGERQKWKTLFTEHDMEIGDCAEGDHTAAASIITPRRIPECNIELPNIESQSGNMSVKEDVYTNERLFGKTKQYRLPTSTIHNLALAGLPLDAKKMVDSYLTYTNCWFPILEPHELLRTFHQYHRHTEGSRDGQTAVLWATLAFESCQTASTETMPHIDLSQQPLYQKARALIPTEDASHDFGHVQALLILAMMNMGYNRLKSCWLLVGHASRLMSYLERRTTPSGLKTGCIDAFSTRKAHLLVALSILETLLTLRTEALRIFERRHCHASLPEDGLEEWENPKVFGQADEVAQRYNEIPGRIASTFNTLSRSISCLEAISTTKSDLIHSESSNATMLANIQSRMAELQPLPARSAYPHFFLSYTAIQCAIQAEKSAKLSASQVESVPNIGSPETDDIFGCFAKASTALQEFHRIHKPERTPVLLLAIYDQMIECMSRTARDLLDLKGKDFMPTIAAFTDSMQKVSKFWPAFQRVQTNILSLVKPVQRTDLASCAAPGINDEFFGYSDSSKCISVAPQMRGGSMRPLPVVNAAGINTTEQILGWSHNSHQVANSPVVDMSSPSHDTIGSLDVLNPALSEIENHELYYKLAEDDILHWSGVWPEAGLRELGFDANAFEQMYKPG